MKSKTGYIATNVLLAILFFILGFGFNADPTINKGVIFTLFGLMANFGFNAWRLTFQ